MPDQPKHIDTVFFPTRFLFYGHLFLCGVAIIHSWMAGRSFLVILVVMLPTGLLIFATVAQKVVVNSSGITFRSLLSFFVHDEKFISWNDVKELKISRFLRPGGVCIRTRYSGTLIVWPGMLRDFQRFRALVRTHAEMYSRQHPEFAIPILNFPDDSTSVPQPKP